MKYLLSRIKWRLAPYFNFSFPCHIDIELSSKCKLNCDFCFRHSASFARKNMPEQLCCDIINLLPAYTDSIKLNWRGEALENPYWLFYNQKYHKKIVMLNTSLSYPLTQSVLRDLANVDSLSISIDSIIPEYYEKIRKGGNLELVLSNLDKIIDLRSKKKRKIVINRRVAINQRGDTDQEFKDFFEGKVDFDIRPVMPRNEKYKENLIKRKRKYCGQPSRRMVIDVNGNCWACCVAYREQKELYLGNVWKKDILKIWRGEKREKLVKDLKRGILNNACKECTSGDAYE